ncbi:SRPBCC domain-containing protein [bacterium]|nr:SRPBCC domain-containing protein [bacterium]
METQPAFEFVADKERHCINMKREFAADRQTVWDCHTKSELLEKWFAPKPLIAKTKSMDFRPGGHWHYAMIEPNGTAHWGLTEYDSISAIDYYTSKDAFCDEEGNINEQLPRAQWRVVFTALKNGHTQVETNVQYASLDALETVIKMGMQEGIASTFSRLDEVLENMQ